MAKHFKIDGTQILTPDGQPFLIKGINVNGPGWVFKRETLPDLALILDAWQFNAVRLCAAIGWEFAQENNKDMDGIIDAFTARQIPVMIEVHDYTGSYPPDEGYRRGRDAYVYPMSVFKDWWVDKAQRFKDNPYVWFNIMNEPGADGSQASAENWYKAHDEVIGAIRATGAENIIVLDEHHWGQGGGYKGGKDGYASAVIRMGPALNERYPNLLYSLHVYDSWYDGKADFDAYFRDAHALGLCVLLGEFGVGPGNISQHSAIKSMYNSAIPNGIGRMYWAWDDQGLPLTTAGAAWTIDQTDGTTPTNLTWAGDLVWRDTHGTLTAPVPEYTLPLLPNGDFSDGMRGWQPWGARAAASVQDGAPLGWTKGNVLAVGYGGAGGAGRSVALKPNTTYRFSAWGKNSTTANSPATAGIKYCAADKPERQCDENIAFTENEWTHKTVTFTTTETISLMSFAFVWKTDANIAFYLADMTLTEV